MTTHIYHLVDDCGQVRYVGKSRNPRARLGTHLSQAARGRTAVAKWLHSIADVSRIPTIRVVKKCTGDGAVEEMREIRRAFRKGWPILNTVGCTRPMPPSLLRDPIIKARDRMGWSNLRLSKESNVPYSRLHTWLNQPGKTICDHHIDSLLMALGLTICKKRNRGAK